MIPLVSNNVNGVAYLNLSALSETCDIIFISTNTTHKEAPIAYGYLESLNRQVEQ